MRIATQFIATALSKKEEVSQDGKNTYYKLAIEQAGEAGSISCTKDFYENSGVKRLTEYVFHAVYDDKYGSYRLISAQPYTLKA